MSGRLSTAQVKCKLKVVQAFTAEHESPLLLQHEIQLVQSAPAAPDMHNFSLKANTITREVVAVMEIEDACVVVLQMVIKLPPSSPLGTARSCLEAKAEPFYCIVKDPWYCAVAAQYYGSLASCHSVAMAVATKRHTASCPPASFPSKLVAPRERPYL